MAENHERHYSINTLHLIFAIVSVALLVSLVALFAHDYSREWKKYQRDFRKLEVEKARAGLSQESDALKTSKDYQNALKAIGEAQSLFNDKSKELASLQKGLPKLQSKSNLTQQSYQFAKAALDATKYSYEKALAKNSKDLAKQKAAFDKIEEKTSSLRILAEEAKTAIDEQLKKIQAINDIIRQLEKKKSALSKQYDLLKKKLQRLDPKSMSFANKIAESIRNLPVLDFMNPSYKVDQIVLKDLTEDVNFTKVPRVDRCTTCHVGIVIPGYENAPQPFRTHPNLDLYLSSKSPHPLDEFGCTVCHNGRGRGTDFNSTAHMPSSAKQRQEWQKKYHWRQFELTETPMHPLKYVQAGCFQCHDNQTVIKGAEKLNLGLQIIESSGCYGCHFISKYKDWKRAGPDLTYLSAKSTQEWAYRWIWNPKSFRASTRMPSFFEQSNNSDPASIARSKQEVHAIVHYLFEKNPEFKMESPATAAGDPKKGEELVASLGCFACHNTQDPSNEKRDITRSVLRREHGPNLIGLGTKTTKTWIYNWLKEPTRYHPGTRMPNLRLSDEEANHIASYLTSSKNYDFMKSDIPALDEKAIDQIVNDYLVKMTTVDDAKAQLSKMSIDQKLSFAGQKLIKQYGCFACHTIAGFENEKPIGTELTEEGSKSTHKLDFGFVHLEEHTKHAWFEQKLKDPRIFDKDRVRAADEKLKMPNFYFSQEEIEAVTTALLGFVKDKPVTTRIKPRTPENLAIEAGQKIVREFNCQGCHIIEGEGADIEPTVTDWLITYGEQGEDSAKSMTKSFSPPNLKGEGAKVQTAWLYHFLQDPNIIRPWLTVRMPTFGFTSEETNHLLKYFSALDKQDFPFTAPYHVQMSENDRAAGEKLFSKDYFDCGKCHVVGSQLPGGSKDSWAPDLNLARDRLKPDWIIEWIKNPSAIQPGTKMPTFFDPSFFDTAGPDDILSGDENTQIRVLRDYILTLTGEQKPADPSKKPTPVQKPSPVEKPEVKIPDAGATSPAIQAPPKEEAPK